MESIEELEQAIDAMEGIDIDGGEIDTSDVREARVRSSYIDWCKEYGKTADESRFPTFSSNFLAMEEYAKENGREMIMNKYADCSEDEYRALTQGKDVYMLSLIREISRTLLESNENTTLRLSKIELDIYIHMRSHINLYNSLF
jgi:hypothetical protein